MNLAGCNRRKRSDQTIQSYNHNVARVISIGLAGFAGTIARYWLSGFIARRFGETFPTGTLIVNVVGCFLAGFLSYSLFERFLVSEMVRTVVLIGLLGGFTTFFILRIANFQLVARRRNWPRLIKCSGVERCRSDDGLAGIHNSKGFLRAYEHSRRRISAAHLYR